MIVQERSSPSFAALWQRTQNHLSSLMLTETPLPAAENAAGSVRLHSGRWRIGTRQEPLAECRIARLSGVADGLLAMIGPVEPGRLPYFSAELLAAHGRPQFACLDVLAPGLDADLRNEVAEQTTVLSIRHAIFLPRDEAVPRWAVEESPGGFLYTADNSPEILPRLEQAYEDYLNVWLDFAHAPAASPAPSADEADQAFRHLRATRPSFLEQYFGEEWTKRFLAEFWYG